VKRREKKERLGNKLEVKREERRGKGWEVKWGEEGGD
jgi:hypothetical protein